jgi:hypothetical protein
MAEHARNRAEVKQECRACLHRASGLTHLQQADPFHIADLFEPVCLGQFAHREWPHTVLSVWIDWCAQWGDVFLARAQSMSVIASSFGLLG